MKKKEDWFACTKERSSVCLVGLFSTARNCDFCNYYGKCTYCARENTQTCRKCIFVEGNEDEVKIKAEQKRSRKS